MITQTAEKTNTRPPTENTSNGLRRRSVRQMPSSAVESLYFRVNDAAHRLCISRSALYGLMSRGEIAYARFGRSRRVPKAALEEYERRCLVGSMATA